MIFHYFFQYRRLEFSLYNDFLKSTLYFSFAIFIKTEMLEFLEFLSFDANIKSFRSCLSRDKICHLYDIQLGRRLVQT